MKNRNLVILFQLSFHIHLYLYTYLAPVSVSQVVAGAIRLRKKRLQKILVLRRLYLSIDFIVSVGREKVSVIRPQLLNSLVPLRNATSLEIMTTFVSGRSMQVLPSTASQTLKKRSDPFQIFILSTFAYSLFVMAFICIYF